jgi:WD40 repeat protein
MPEQGSHVAVAGRGGFESSETHTSSFQNHSSFMKTPHPPKYLRAALAAALLMHASFSHSFDLLGWFGKGGDSGSGRIAQVQFHLRDGFVPTTLVWSPDGRFIATSGTQTRNIHIWDVEQQKLVRDLLLPNPPSGVFHNMAWSPDSRYLVTCNTFESSLRIYDSSDWHVFKDFGRDEIGCHTPAFSSDGQELAILGHDLIFLSTKDWTVIKKMELVDPEMPNKSPRPGVNQLFLKSFAYVPGTHTLVFGGGRYEDGESCAVGDQPRTGRLWLLSPEEMAARRSIPVYCSPKGGDVELLAFHPDGKQLATETGTNSTASDGRTFIADSVHIISFPDGRLLSKPLNAVGMSYPGGMTYTPDGRYLLVGVRSSNEKAALYIVDAQTQKVIDTLHADTAILDLAVHPKSTFFAAAAGTGVTVWKFK